MTISEKILNMRRARGWSQEELAEHIGVTRQAVSRWESGAAKPDADKIVTICGLFGVSADYLLGLSEQPEPQNAAQTIIIRKEKPVRMVTRTSVGWILLAASAVVMILSFLLMQFTDADLFWLVWISVSGMGIGFFMGPLAKFSANAGFRMLTGWVIILMVVVPAVIWVLAWEMTALRIEEFPWPLVSALAIGVGLAVKWEE